MYGVKTPIYQPAQIREFERLATERFAISAQVLMQRAGKAAFDYLQRRWPHAVKLAVFCGVGNNGGDGYILAQQAIERGLQVTVWQIGDHTQLKNEAKHAMEECLKSGVTMRAFHGEEDLQRPDIVIDAIFGIGFKNTLPNNVIAAIEKIEELDVPVFALDVPTGVDAETGNVPGTALHATATITFIGFKLGLLTGEATSYTGELVCNDLHLPTDLFSTLEPIAKKIHLSAYGSYLEPRDRNWHKGLSGHVLIVGGDDGYLGATRLAAEAALRVGAGLVSVATRPEHAAMMNSRCPEIMSHGVATPDQLEPLLAKANVVVLGPGLGQSEWAKKLWEQVCMHELPKVVDADGLNLLSQTTLFHENWILTPHPGEAARLLEISVLEVQQNRFAVTHAIQKRYGGVSVLKGAGTIVMSAGVLPALCDKGNPGMASAGMGDVLSGIIGGLVAQKMPLSIAAKLGVLVHAMVGDLAAKDGERGMIATDLLPFIRRLVNPQPQS